VAIIYKCTNLCNGKIYIGKTIGSLKNRIRVHLWNATAGSRTYFHSSIRKYGADNFKWEVIDRCLFNEPLCDLERRYIGIYNCMAPHGMNLTRGGDGADGHRHTVETKRKLSIAKLGDKNPFYGRHHSRDTIEKIRRPGLGRGRHLSDETKRRLSHSCMGRRHTEESKIKMSKSRRGKKHSAATRTKMSLALMGNTRWLGKKHSRESLERMAEARRKYWENWREKHNQKTACPMRGKIVNVAGGNRSLRPRGARNCRQIQRSKA
jgi:group I intron endonuclease